jgi:hypothetical protein
VPLIKAAVAIGATLGAGVLTVSIVRMQQPPEAPLPPALTIEPLRPEPLPPKPVVVQEPLVPEAILLPPIEIVGRPRRATPPREPVPVCATPWTDLESGPAGRQVRTLMPCDRLLTEQRLR